MLEVALFSDMIKLTYSAFTIYWLPSTFYICAENMLINVHTDLLLIPYSWLRFLDMYSILEDLAWCAMLGHDHGYTLIAITMYMLWSVNWKVNRSFNRYDLEEIKISRRVVGCDERGLKYVRDFWRWCIWSSLRHALLLYTLIICHYGRSYLKLTHPL